MTAGQNPERSRLLRDLAAIIVGLSGATATIWAAAATDWRALTFVLGLYGVLAAVGLAQGSDE